MNTKKLNQWITALRSGEYKQGKGYLKVDNEYCCLGVYCDVNKIPHDQDACYPPDAVVSKSFDIMLAMMNDGNYHEMPASVRQDIKDDVEIPLGISFAYSKKYSFEDIADYLETHKEKIINDDRKESE